jgi:glycosyltransferase involved in cell wall biosynthesis
MRVLLVLRYFYSPSFPIGGAERQALKLAGRLIDEGVDVTVVTGQWEWAQPKREEIEGVPVHRHFTGWGMSKTRGFGRVTLYLYLVTLFLYLVRHRREYDVIHCHSAMYGASMVVLAGRLLRKRTLVRAMASGPWGDVKRLREGERGTIWGSKWMLGKLKDADCLVALNRQVAEELAESGVESDRIIRIPNGVEVGSIQPKTDHRLGCEITITFVGRLHPQKGVDVLLLAFQQVREQMPQFSWRLRLIGTGRRLLKLEEMARRLGIEQWVEFAGQVDDPLPLLYQSDMFVLPSRSEGISNALLEAMAHGLPCIATDIAGNNDVITHLCNGLLVQPEDQDDLADAIASLATNQTLREELGHEALRTVQEEYSLDSAASQYLALYTKLLHSGEGRKVGEIGGEKLWGESRDKRGCTTQQPQGGG